MILFPVHDKGRDALTWVCVIDFEMGKVTACRAAERDQVSYPVSLQVICLSCTYSQFKLF
jgi:hypothetical protein